MGRANFKRFILPRLQSKIGVSQIEESKITRDGFAANYFHLPFAD